MARKQPKLVLRETCVEDVSRTWPVGRFFEAGAGTGHMSSIFVDRGFRGVAHDLGETSRNAMRERFKGATTPVEVVDAVAELADEDFDYLFAFEVLEHIERDAEVLTEWTAKLRRGGKILISVPAHARKYGRSDAMVGHVRRYERSEVRTLLERCGYRDIQIVNYGWPVTELTRRISNRLIADKEQGFEGLSAEARSILSAQTQPPIIQRILRVAGGNAFLPFAWLQRFFYRYDLGDGIVAWAIRN
jgi:SAM-dependent methyltransferase